MCLKCHAARSAVQQRPETAQVLKTAPQSSGSNESSTSYGKRLRSEIEVMDAVTSETEVHLKKRKKGKLPRLSPSPSSVQVAAAGQDDAAHWTVLYSEDTPSDLILDSSRTIAASPTDSYGVPSSEPIPPSSDPVPLSAQHPVSYATSCFNALQERFLQSQEQIEQLQHMLEAQRAEHERKELYMRQEMYHDMLSKQKSIDATIASLHREKHYINKELESTKAELASVTNASIEKDSRCIRLAREARLQREEAESLNTINKQLEEDIDELRRIENEDAARRRQKLLNEDHLPPAYGSLDDSTQQQHQAPQLHRDSGNFDVALLKRNVRAEFTDRIRKAQININQALNRPVPNLQMADRMMFTMTTYGLRDACLCLKTALDHAASMLVSVALGHKSRKKTARSAVRREYVADRAAKTIIDLTWRLISACELRPAYSSIGPMFTPEDKARFGLAYQEVDEILLDALRGAKSDVWDFQFYLTQINAVKDRVEKLHVDYAYLAFEQSAMWLEEQVEAARVLMAREVVREEEEQWVDAPDTLLSEGGILGQDGTLESLNPSEVEAEM